MTISVRTRFEIFKRDRFTCVYCGRKPPEVLLEADHLIPRAAGGSDDEDNLVTACWDCNRGKSDRLLDESSMPVPSVESQEAARDRVEQLQASAELAKRERALLDRMAWNIGEAWAIAFGATKTTEPDGSFAYTFSSGGFPPRESIRRVLRRLPMSEALEAVDITAGRFRWPNDNAIKYFFGVCWRKVDNSEGKS
jgi:hypothetical protein